nr:immunoglobulin light chain junction region [Macaca mulatta]
CMQGKECPLTF